MLKDALAFIVDLADDDRRLRSSKNQAVAMCDCVRRMERLIGWRFPIRATTNQPTFIRS